MNVEDTYPHSSLLVSPSETQESSHDHTYCVISVAQAHIQTQGSKQLNTFSTLTQLGNKLETFNECFPLLPPHSPIPTHIF